MKFSHSLLLYLFFPVTVIVGGGIGFSWYELMSIIQTPSPAALYAPAPLRAAGESSSLKYFGYYDSGFREEDMQTVAPYTNFAFTHLEYVPILASHGLKGMLYVPASMDNGIEDFKARLDAKEEAVRAVIDPNGDGNTNDSLILGFYFSDEPVWNGHNNAYIRQAANYLKSKFPTVPILLVESVPGLGNQPGCIAPTDARTSKGACVAPLKVPVSVDWIGFDAYGIRNPDTDSWYQEKYRLLKSKRSRTDQKIFVVMDAWWHPWEHGNRGVKVEEMAEYARNYHQFAKSDQDIIGIAAWVWEGRSYGPQNDPRGPTIGTKDFPQNVKAEHMRIGAKITGKPVVFPPTHVYALPKTSQSVPRGQWTKMLFGDERMDDAAEWVNENSVLRPASAQTLAVTVSLTVQNATPNAAYRVAIVKNDRRVAVERVRASVGGPFTFTIEKDISVAPGDRLSIAVRHNSTSTAVTVPISSQSFLRIRTK